MKISSITGPEPVRNGEYPDNYHVGYSGITRIEEETENLGSYGILWLKVYRGDELIAKMNALHVANVSYQPAS